MAKKRSKRSSADTLLDGLEGGIESGVSFFQNISGESWRKIAAVVLLLIAILYIFSIFELGGPAGATMLSATLSLLGMLGYGTPLALMYSSYYTYVGRLPGVRLFTLLGGSTLTLSLLALMNVLSGTTVYGGLAGDLLAVPFVTFFSYYPSILFLIGLSFISFVFVFDRSPEGTLMHRLAGLFNMEFVSDGLQSLKDRFSNNSSNEEAVSIDDLEDIDEEDLDVREKILRESSRADAAAKQKSSRKQVVQEEIEYEEEAEEVVLKEKSKPRDAVQSVREKKESKDNSLQAKEILETSSDFIPPPLSLLQRDSGKPGVGDLKTISATIKRTLQEFGIQVEMDEVSIGPSVTRYALKPAQGTKLSKIASHKQELAYALEAETLRIEAPIPGKSLVGIEVPNITKSTVGLASLFQEPDWRAQGKPLLVALGRGVSGQAVYANLAKMPHLLIAGTTGSGKSVTVHGIIASLLYRNSPYDLKFIMVDPKKVELSFYNDIPHLYTPVITNAKVTIRTLNWAVNEMERRYDVLQESGVQNIDTYHKNIFTPAVKKAAGDESAELPERMPYIVIIIDELADIMMSYPKELEAAIVRLAQKSRAVGIHLILSTQRPSVNVITGLIKANIPSRVALKVISQIDSRTIIDTAGAEQLLGRGDMLFISSENPKQERIQAPFLSEEEIKKVATHLRTKYKGHLLDEIDINSTPQGTEGAVFSSDQAGSGDADDDLYEQAKEIVVSSRKASTSYLQRRLKIGYSRAARLIDILEERGVIGAGDGAKPREVLVDGGEEKMETNTSAEFESERF